MVLPPVGLLPITLFRVFVLVTARPLLRVTKDRSVIKDWTPGLDTYGGAAYP
jgi:hypothetical protein